MQIPISMIDIGANLTNQRFHSDLDAVLERARQSGVSQIIVTGTSEAGSSEALELVRRYPAYLRSTAGVHPHDAKSWTSGSTAAITLLAQQPQVVAVGECGLDYNRMFSPEADQLRCFEAQLQIAVELKKPVFLHERDAHDTFFALLKQHRASLKGAVVHCFTGTLAQMRAYLDLDCHIGITGWVCDERRGDDLREAVRFLPADRMMIETDAPYLPPRHVRPKPAGNRNEPMYLGAVLETVAEICDVPAATLAEQLRRNTVEFFDLGRT